MNKIIILIILIQVFAGLQATSLRTRIKHRLRSHKKALYKNQAKSSLRNPSSPRVPQGRDTQHHQKASTLSAMVKVMSKISHGSPLSFRKFFVKTNQETVFLVKDGAQSNYKEVVNSLKLKELVKSTDNIVNYQCCERVTVVQPPTKVQIDGEEVEQSCFKISAFLSEWTICHKDANAIVDFREALIKNVIIASGVNLDPSVQYPKEPIQGTYAWNWIDQDSWQGLCKEGAFQSPIDVVGKSSKSSQDVRMVFLYEEIAVPTMKEMEKGPKNPKTAVWDGNEIKLYGKFGNFLHISQGINVVYQADYVQFKFPSEHKINGMYYDGEVQVHHKADDGTVAIVSFMIEKLQEPGKNAFFENIQPETWVKKDKASTELKKDVLLEELIKGGLSGFFRKNFFWYVGSETTPPCYEGVNHFVMETPIKVSKFKVDAVQQAVTMGGSTNQRILQESKNRKVIHYKDDTNVCDYSAPDLDGKPKEDPDNVETDTEPKLPDLAEGKFYEMHVKLQQPIYVPPEGASQMVTGSLGNGIDINPRQTETTEKDLKKLKKKYKTRYPEDFEKAKEEEKKNENEQEAEKE